MTKLKKLTIAGLTGGIASGKSTVSKILSQYKIPILDADLVARSALEKGSSGYKQTIESFGEKILEKDCTINRKKLASIVFTDNNAKIKLEKIIHPIVREYFDNWTNNLINKGFELAVYEAALLIETGYNKKLDKIIVVDIDEKTQTERLKQRGTVLLKDGINRIKNQISRSQRLKYADYVLENSGNISELDEKVKKLAEWLNNLINI